MKTIHSFGGVSPLTTHAWNAEGNSVAISKNNKEVEVKSPWPLRSFEFSG